MTNIAMWSGPRNISTAMMYSFANRADCVAWDEPFYSAYLIDTGLNHPMKKEIIEATNIHEDDYIWAAVAASCMSTANKPICYQKHMTHHMLPIFDRKHLLAAVTNAFLIRSPEKVLASYAKKHDEVSLHAIGFVEQAEIFDQVTQLLGHAPPVVDADKHLANPRASLVKLCDALAISFDEAMLHWPAGPKSCDGVWAPHWYNAAWKSTGFETVQAKEVRLDKPLQDMADRARPYYEKLKAFAL